jgi:UDP-glucose 4-epimerase
MAAMETMEAAGMTETILVTGGAGYIGSHTCVALLEAGYDVVVVDDLSNGSERAVAEAAAIAGRSIDFHRIDVADRASTSPA